MVKNVTTTTRNYARGALEAFLEGKKSLNWAIGMIRSSGVKDQRLAEVFNMVKGYGDSNRRQEALTACRKQGWLK